MVLLVTSFSTPRYRQLWDKLLNDSNEHLTIRVALAWPVHWRVKLGFETRVSVLNGWCGVDVIDPRLPRFGLPDFPVEDPDAPR